MLFFIKNKRKFAIYFSLLLLSCVSAQAADPLLGDKKDFWVWDLNVMPPGSRRATATLRFSGSHSYIFVEDALWEKNISSAFVQRLAKQLEEETPNGSPYPNLGIIPIEERIFGPLPAKITPDRKLIVLFADLGKYKDFSFDGFYNAYDQLTDEEAQKEGQRSNEANIIYINGLRKDEKYTTGVIAHELQHLLAHYATGSSEFSQDLWLSETLAEGAMLLTGYNTDQSHINSFAASTDKYPLVSHTYVQYGPQLLFASYLLDTIKQAPLSFLTKLSKKGSEAIEFLFRQKTDTPLSFDAVFSHFISYVFEHAQKQSSLPLAWRHDDKDGISIPPIQPYALIRSFPAQLDGTIYPYTFLAIDLEQSLPSTALVQVEAIQNTEGNDDHCKPSVLWKPIQLKRLAIYSVGCEHKSKDDLTQFRLRILDKPFLLPPSPLKIGF